MGTGCLVTVRAAGGAGSEWLGLSNAGIECDVPTIAGATYTFSLDYAGALGLAVANTRIAVYVDGVQVGSYASAGGATALNWEALSFTFKGNGQARSLCIELEGGTDTSTARGAMTDALKVVETLPSGANVAYGLVNGAVALPAIGARLADGDIDASLKTELFGLVGQHPERRRAPADGRARCAPSRPLASVPTKPLSTSHHVSSNVPSG